MFSFFLFSSPSSTKPFTKQMSLRRRKSTLPRRTKFGSKISSYIIFADRLNARHLRGQETGKACLQSSLLPDCPRMFYRLHTCLLLKDQCVRNGHLDVVVPCSDESVNHISISYVTSVFPKEGEEEEDMLAAQDSPSYKTQYPCPTPNHLQTLFRCTDDSHKLVDSHIANLCHCKKSLLFHRLNLRVWHVRWAGEMLMRTSFGLLQLMRLCW